MAMHPLVVLLTLCLSLSLALARPNFEQLLKEAQRKRTLGSFTKRNGAGHCEPYQPFQCPSGECIPIKYLCDGRADCSDSYDENSSMCTAASRPPVDDTARFLDSLLKSHGKDFLAKIFGANAKDDMAAMGGVQKVAVALSENMHASDFGAAVGMSAEEVDQMQTVMESVADGEVEGLDDDEADDFRFFAVKLLETEFF